MDFALLQDDQGGWDIGIANGDFARDNLGLRTAITASLLSDRRATSDDDIDNDYKGGVWHDAWPDFEGDKFGSRLYLLRRRLQNRDTLQEAKVYAREALEWMLIKNIASAINVTTKWERDGVLSIHLSVTLVSNEIFEQSINYLLEAI